MDATTVKLIEQAGRFIQVGKLSHALESYLKAHKLNSGETTIINMIGDLYARLGKEAEALLWYHRLADTLRSQELFSNASAAYKKILKLSPQNWGVMTALAELYEKQGLVAKANEQYRSIAADMMNREEHAGAIAIYLKICTLDPASHEDQLRLAHGLEKVGTLEAATIIQFLESGVRGDSRPETGLALGVSEADLGLVQTEQEQQLILEEFN